MLHIQGKKILICGAGGVSGQAAAQLCLYKAAAQVLLSDQRKLSHYASAPTFADSRSELLDLTPRQDAAILTEFQPDSLVCAPGVAPSLELLQSARQQGRTIYSENDLGYVCLLQEHAKQNKPPPYIIAVTGTDGKSTTCALLVHLLHECTPYRALACGNYGRPLSEVALAAATQDEFYDVLVVECSSFQLENLQYFAPQTALLLNIAVDHTDRYASLTEYLHAKLNIARKQTSNDIFFVAQDLHANSVAYAKQQQWRGRLQPVSLAPAAASACVWGEQNLLPLAELALRGTHNAHNVHFALVALRNLSARQQLCLETQQLKDALRTFTGLPHRLERVRQCALPASCQLEFYNDSKATTVHAAVAALTSFSTPRTQVFLLCGGRSKGGDFTLLTQESRSAIAGKAASIQHVFTFGEAAALIAASITQVKSKQKTKSANSDVAVSIWPDLATAFQAACQAVAKYIQQLLLSGAQKNVTQPHDTNAINAAQPATKLIILLSPACASFDAYSDYKERGDHFCQLARGYTYV